MGKGDFFIRVTFWLFLVFNLCSLIYCSVINNITSSTPVSFSKTLNSPGQVFELGFFTPTNSLNQYVGIWFKEISPRTVVWVANRVNPVTNSSASLTIGRDGNLRLLDGQGNTLWSTNVSASSNGSIAVLTDDGVFLLRDRITGTTLWDSSKNLSDTLLPGKWLAYNHTSGERIANFAWKSENDPSFGDFTSGVSAETPPQAFVWKRSKPHWRSGLWDKSIFLGIPEMDGDYSNGLSLIDGIQTGTYYVSVGVLRNCSYSMLRLSSSGVLKFMCWEKARGWYTRWQGPNTPCEVYGACGTFGVCRRNEQNLTCKCLRGFVPKSDVEWNKGNWTGGCVRRTELSCGRIATNNAMQGGNRDGFLKVSGLLLPASSNFWNVWDESECGMQCMNNCSCSAYAYVHSIGCLAWTGQLVDTRELSSDGHDLYLRLADSDLINGDNTKKNTLVISIIVVSSVATVAAIIYGFIKLRTINSFIKNAQIKSQKDSSFEFSHSGDTDRLRLPLFDFESILIATNNFDIENKLGQGGYGPVYKGKLPNGKDVAIKRLASSSGQGINEFKNEVKLISKLQHRNLVKLIGCCIDSEEKILIYEFMSNKSLDTYIFEDAKKMDLDWAKRFNIITGVARGLLYLHRDSCLRVIHRDLKVSNILLDDKMNPKISDFGLARIFEGTQYLGSTRKIAGTIGYMAPEYLLRGLFSEKSDVYSFGVLTLEIVSGRKASSYEFDEQNLSLIAYAWQSWCKRRGLDMIDEAIGHLFSALEVSKCVQVGLLCVQDRATERPTMASIVAMLTGEKAKMPEPKQPTFTFESSSTSTWSANSVTQTAIEPR